MMPSLNIFLPEPLPQNYSGGLGEYYGYPLLFTACDGRSCFSGSDPVGTGAYFTEYYIMIVNGTIVFYDFIADYVSPQNLFQEVGFRSSDNPQYPQCDGLSTAPCA
jgi:hypothetical protein